MLTYKNGNGSWINIPQSDEFDQDMVLTLGFKDLTGASFQSSYMYAKYNSYKQDVEYGSTSSIDFNAYDKDQVYTVFLA